MIHKLTVGPLNTNCYIISNNLNECIVIDPGEDGIYISEKLTSLGLAPLAMLATHGHHDHVGGALTLQLIYAIPLYISFGDIDILKRVRKTSVYFSSIDPGPMPDRLLNVASNSKIVVGDFDIHVVSLPGHTPGGVGYVISNNLFCGDILFADGTRGESNHRYSDPLKLSSSVDVVSKFSGTVWPGHGEEFVPTVSRWHKNDD